MPKVNVKVPKRSGFNKSHRNLLTTQCGTLTPILCDELIPSQKVNLKQVISASLPPLASDTFMKCDLKVEAFFVPTRLLYGGFENWLTKQPLFDPEQGDYTSESSIPVVRILQNTDMEYLYAGSLADYLGMRFMDWEAGPAPYVGNYNIFPFLAYHKIYDDWYRNTLVQTPVFFRPTGAGFDATSLGSLPYRVAVQGVETHLLQDKFADGVSLGSLRQRNFGFDYFTLAMPNAQLGSELKVTVPLQTPIQNTGTFTIAALRAANSLQQFAERNQLGGLRYQDYIKNNYGADLSNGVAQRALLLGSASVPVYSKGVYSNSMYGAETVLTRNPFESSVGAEFGSASCNGQIDLVDNFTANEPGYLMVLASLVPTVTYSTGIDRMLLRYNAHSSQTDMANPLLQNVGNQPIYRCELTGYNSDAYKNNIFGYADRYSDYKYKNDTLHGLLRDGETLESFALQRSFENSLGITISEDFLPIPTDYLDQVAAIDGSISSFGVWIDCYSDYRTSMPLAEYAIPSLQDPAYEHGMDVSIDVGGSRL